MNANSAYSPETYSTEDNMLNEMLGAFYSGLKNSYSGYLNDTLSANTTQAQTDLTNMIKNGGMYQAYLVQADGNRATDLENNAIQMLYGLMIPAGWQVSPKKPRPFILRVDRRDYTCGAPVKSNPGHTTDSGAFNLGDWMNDDTAKKTSWCDPDGNSFFLLTAHYSIPTCGGKDCNPTWTDSNLPFQILPGGDTGTLAGAQATWGGVKVSDIIKSSFGGFVANGNKNGYTMPHDTNLLTNTDLSVSPGDLPLQGGILTPGFFNLTVCLNASEASGAVFSAGDSSEPPKCDNAYNDVSPTTNSAGYAPGNCGIHVTQYQKNEGNENPLPYYQLQVTIKDAANTQIGFATKQMVNPAMIIHSKLPYQVYVSVGTVDTDVVCFWYSDQWFCSNDQAHKCNFGAYDSGKREGDCGFSCPNPTLTPPVSAPQSKPTGATTANNGAPAPVTNTAPPAPSLTGDYAPGNCNAHIRQFQKNEGANSEDPGPNYKLEITIKDGKGKIVADSGVEDAPKDVLVPVQGPLPYAFDASTLEVDHDPINFSYNGGNWNSNDKNCKVGGYDSGARDMDCGFTC